MSMTGTDLEAIDLGDHGRPETGDRAAVPHRAPDDGSRTGQPGNKAGTSGVTRRTARVRTRSQRRRRTWATRRYEPFHVDG